MIDRGFTSIPLNFRNNVDWILGAYEDAGVTFANGFQKDAIQNAVGARKTDKWENWNCDISLIKNNNGIYVVVEDSGTVGLTGKNISTVEIEKMMANEKPIPSEERLSRFTSMFNSGGNTTGGGLYGAGKSVYSVASKTYTYYFDSLREDGEYIANINKQGQVYNLAFENDEAKKYIFNKTGLTEKKTVGTRVIIENPKEELVNAINDGSIISFIQESWWLIIQRFDNESSISVNGIPVRIPENIKKAHKSFELENKETYEKGYDVKHFGFYVFENGGNEWNGISYYRKGMKIGEIDVKDIPEKIRGKFWGYIEVDRSWEEELSEVEDKVHFGVSKGKKSRRVYQNLKNYCNKKINDLLVNWGYIKNKENEDRKLKNEMMEIAEDIQTLFDKLGYEDLGKGPKKPDFDVRWQDVVYPENDTEKVVSGDEIKFSIRISNMYTTDKEFEYKLSVFNHDTGEYVSSIAKDRVKIKTKILEKLNFSIRIDKHNSVRYAENIIRLSVKVVGSGKEKIKELSYFYDIDPPIKKREGVSLTLHECSFPHENSRRVEFNDKIKDICYRIENKRNRKLKYKLNISIHNASDPSLFKIVDICSFSGTLKPFDEVITPYIDEIVFDEIKYKPYITKGILELRARIISDENDGQYEKGDKITFYNYKIFLNCDNKIGNNDAFNVQSVDSPDNYKRSWYSSGPNRTIFLNVGHYSYLNVQEYPELQHEYLREQMLKQYVLLYLSEGKFDMFDENDKDFIKLEPQEAAERVIEKMENIYTKSLK